MLQRARSHRGLAFVLVGGMNTAIGLAIFLTAYHFAGSTIGYVGALVAAYTLALPIAFLTQRRLVFRSDGAILLELARYSAVQATAFVLNLACLPALVEVFGVPVRPGQVLSLGITTVLLYLTHLKFTFRRGARPAQGSSSGPRS